MAPGASSVSPSPPRGRTVDADGDLPYAGPSPNPITIEVDPRRVTRTAPTEDGHDFKRRASLLVVLAHPMMGKSFIAGMLMHSSQALRVATNGEAGKSHLSVGAVDDLGSLRIEDEVVVSQARHRPAVRSWVSTTPRVVSASGRPSYRAVLANVDMLEVEDAARAIDTCRHTFFDLRFRMAATIIPTISPYSGPRRPRSTFRAETLGL